MVKGKCFPGLLAAASLFFLENFTALLHARGFTTADSAEDPRVLFEPRIAYKVMIGHVDARQDTWEGRFLGRSWVDFRC